MRTNKLLKNRIKSLEDSIRLLEKKIEDLNYEINNPFLYELKYETDEYVIISRGWKHNHDISFLHFGISYRHYKQYKVFDKVNKSCDLWSESQLTMILNEKTDKKE